MNSKHRIFTLYLLVTLALLVHQAYFVERSDFKWLFFDVSLLFMAYAVFSSRLRLDQRYGRYLIIASIAMRFCLLFYQPNLSDDFYRFAWDGELVVSGINPYEYLPEELDGNKLSQQQLLLRNKMNSPNYYSVYPPLNQYLFAFAAFFSGGSLFVMVVLLKCLLFLFDLLSIFLLPKLLSAIGQPLHYAALYLLNPLVVIETIGNLHFEGVSVAMLILFFYFLTKGTMYFMPLFLGMAASIKLLPFVLFPLIWRKLGLVRGAIVLVLAGLLFWLSFIPFLDHQFIAHIFDSIGLYFNSFEFNAGIYYVVRAIGFEATGYNIIATAGTTMALVSTMLILALALTLEVRTWEVFFSLGLISFFVYYLLGTTVHPWYLIHVLLLACLSGRLLATIPWTFLVFFSYYAYSQPAFKEDSLLLIVEYSIVIIAFILELKMMRDSGLFKFRKLNLRMG
ncbi:MAG: hypothetical protein RIC15_07730 [Vicingaceae bacterium]